jgi:hypothetical protein
MYFDVWQTNDIKCWQQLVAGAIIDRYRQFRVIG